MANKNVSPSIEGRVLAENFRNIHSLGTGPLLNVFDAVKFISVDIIVLPLGDNTDALTISDPQSGLMTIGINTTNNAYRQRFSIAHEIGHIVAGDLSPSTEIFECQSQSPEETRAHSFARHLLCPITALHSHFDSTTKVTIEDLSHVVRTFKVTPHVAAIQLKDAGIINQIQSDEFYKISTRTLASRFGWREEFDIDCEISQKFFPSPQLVLDATNAYRHGLVSIGAVATARGKDVDEIQKEIAEAMEIDSSTPQKHAPRDTHPFDELNDFFG
ncbi:ImmA/IrrE family metallo-endopeptidase [Arcanobacterium bovis]|uniref:ImmA/IrrE family metallo-endopeptidase n=1 Tax=Arcanobacterium bovis TaxID=2529275 RepID=A0A4Q9UYU7_9ACTO|nr:ImmA/IrrE family metallo-endopeptidase [Arcanobacterium bovis]TBW20845.1 ImmA/IrrE family metallo-endopeptidase [Arcanobacterium bovis]